MRREHWISTAALGIAALGLVATSEVDGDTDVGPRAQAVVEAPAVRLTPEAALRVFRLTATAVGGPEAVELRNPTMAFGIEVSLRGEQRSATVVARLGPCDGEAEPEVASWSAPASPEEALQVLDTAVPAPPCTEDELCSTEACVELETLDEPARLTWTVTAAPGVSYSRDVALEITEEAR